VLLIEHTRADCIPAAASIPGQVGEFKTEMKGQKGMAVGRSGEKAIKSQAGSGQVTENPCF
jgi:hypothetical protein